MKSRRSLFALAAIMLIFAGCDLVRRFGPSRARRALPTTAHDVSEKWEGLGFFGDFTRILKARCPQEDFPKYAQLVGATVRYDPAVHGDDYHWVTSVQSSGPDWWNEPREFEECYFSYVPGDDYVLRVKFNDGYVFYYEAQW